MLSRLKKAAFGAVVLFVSSVEAYRGAADQRVKQNSSMEFFGALAAIAVPVTLVAMAEKNRILFWLKSFRYVRAKPQIPTPIVNSHVVKQSMSNATTNKGSTVDKTWMTTTIQLIPERYSRSFSTTQTRNEKTRDIREVLRQKQENREKAQAAVAAAKLAAQQTIKPVRATSSTSTVLALTAMSSSTATAIDVAIKPRKPLRAYIEAIFHHAKKLVVLRGLPSHSSDSVRTKHLLVLYHLHKYNLVILDLMKEYPLQRTNVYGEIVIPLRTGMAHFASQVTAGQTSAALLKVYMSLNDFVTKKGKMNLKDVMAAIDANCLLLSETALFDITKKSIEVEFAANTKQNYDDFQNKFFAELLQRAQDVKQSTQGEFSSEDKRNALSMLVMMSLEKLPSHRLPQMRAEPKTFARGVVRLIEKIRDVRNRVSHDVDDVSVTAFNPLYRQLLRQSHVSKPHSNHLFTMAGQSNGVVSSSPAVQVDNNPFVPKFALKP